VLFKSGYPREYRYFCDILEQSLGSGMHDDEDRPLIEDALRKLASVSVARVCACGQPGCATFNFVDYSEVEDKESMLLDGISDCVILDIDGRGDLIGIEKTPTQ
jgi:hypothetical protein